MKTEVLMVILSLLENGQMSSAFVNTPSMTSCQQRANMVRSILTSGKVEIREIKCVTSSLKFEKFNHKTASSAPRYLYSIRLGDTDAVVTKIDDLATCKTQQTDTKSSDRSKLFCTSSTQKMKASP